MDSKAWFYLWIIFLIIQNFFTSHQLEAMIYVNVSNEKAHLIEWQDGGIDYHQKCSMCMLFR